MTSWVTQGLGETTMRELVTLEGRSVGASGVELRHLATCGRGGHLLDESDLCMPTSQPIRFPGLPAIDGLWVRGAGGGE